MPGPPTPPSPKVLALDESIWVHQLSSPQPMNHNPNLETLNPKDKRTAVDVVCMQLNHGKKSLTFSGFRFQGVERWCCWIGGNGLQGHIAHQTTPTPLRPPYGICLRLGPSGVRFLNPECRVDEAQPGRHFLRALCQHRLANMAHIRQSRLNSGLGFQVKFRETL